MLPALFFHVDLDAFFASVEQLDHPEYRGLPVIVGGDPSRRGVVSTCSYEARRFGVRSAMPMSRAVALCPQAVFLRGNMERYGEKSREVMRVLASFSPDVRQMSIDEAFLDMTGTERLFGQAEAAARLLKDRVREETGLTVSVGAAPNRYLAKIASGLRKPDGLTVIEPGGEASFMASLPLDRLWGVGEKTRERLADAGITTMAEILSASERLLASVVGPAGGAFIYRAARGVDDGVFREESASKSISSERTFECDLADPEAVETALLELSSDVMYRLLDEGFSSRTVHVKLRYADFRTVSVQETQERRVNDSADLFARAQALFRRKWERGEPVRLVGVACQNLYEGASCDQGDLFDRGDAKRKRKVEEALLALSRKRGPGLVTRARLIDAEGDDR